jgi:hypothetical protein
MKVKLLKKVRRKYRVVVNELGIEKVQENSIIFGWDDLYYVLNVDWEIALRQALTNRKLTSNEKLLVLLHSKYNRYHRKTKVAKMKSSNWKVK